MEKVFFDSWESVLRTLIIGVLAYAVLVLQLRVSGKRTLSKMNAFDFIVTVALGSTLATVLLSKDVALLDGLLAFGLLILLQFVITWLSVRHAAISDLVKAKPVLLLFQGNYLWEAMKAERITKEEILAAMRSQGISAVEEVGAVVLETEGSLSIIKKIEGNESSVLEDVSKREA
ncbi:membrane protein [Rufibacter radiotolerans]|uniref:Membrane protein n=1 Tax=Rufibacter radiotolerans TaxID=1379910 RepID=A0A0H4W2J3_9BACT|nr:YetF domain-containing protein [Rufibacter radiotolerans]AKQ44656.1 membrane protein [Rufibacter radiotolerans]